MISAEAVDQYHEAFQETLQRNVVLNKPNTIPKCEIIWHKNNRTANISLPLSQKKIKLK